MAAATKYSTKAKILKAGKEMHVSINSVYLKFFKKEFNNTSTNIIVETEI